MPLFIGTILGLDYQPISREDLLYTQNEVTSQTLLTHQDYLASTGIVPWIAMRWETFDVAATFNIQTRYRMRLVGEDTQEVEIGAMQIGFDFRPLLRQKGPIRSYLGLGLSGHIPLVSVQYSDEIQQADLTPLVEQYRTEIFSLHGRLSIGGDYNFSQSFSVGLRIDQRFFWDPIYTDEFGVEYLFGIQSEGTVTLSWHL